MNLLKTHAKQTLLFIFLLMTTILTQAKDDFDAQRPNGIADKKWNNLKSVVQETKLLPKSEGIGGENSQFGYSVSVDGNRALVGARYIAGGAVVVLEFDGMDWQKVAVLQPRDGIGGVRFGDSVSLSGNRALVGASGDDDNGDQSGAVYIFDYDGVNWVQSAKLTAGDGAEYDRFGESVSLSGTRALVGAYLDNDNSFNSGSAYIFDYDGVNWVQSAKLTAADSAEEDHFGFSVSLSGNRALVGAYRDDDRGYGSGSAYVYEYGGVNWVQSAKLTASDGVEDDWFGYSVSLSGTRALVGAYRDDDSGSESGSAYIYDYNGVNWVQSAKLTAVDGAEYDDFGYSVSLSGNRVLVGAHLDDDNGIESGSAYIYDYDGVNWVQSSKQTAGEGNSFDYFGYSVSLSDDRALVCAYRDDDNGNKSGSAYIYDYNGQSWVQSAKLTAGDGAAGDYFGKSVSLSGDRALVGAYRDDDNASDSGSAYIYEYDGVSWVQSTKLTAGDGAMEDYFGISVSLSGNRALVGAYADDDNGSDSGSVYIYDYDGMSWVQSTKLTADDGAVDDWFGKSVSLSGDRALVGAFQDDDNGSNSGSAYIYYYDGVSWLQSAKLTANDGDSDDNFGISVSLSGDRALVGAYADDDNGSNSGSAYIYDYDGVSWVQSTKLTAADGAEGDFFGISVSLSGDSALVGSYRDDDNGEFSGSAYIFKYSGVSWLQSDKLTAGDGASYDRFGISVSLSGGRTLIGAYGDDDNGNTSGSAYIFNDDFIYKNSFE